MKTKILKVGDSLGIILPEEALLALKASEGDTLFLAEAPENSLRVTLNQPGFADVMKIAEGLMDRYSNALRELGN